MALFSDHTVGAERITGEIRRFISPVSRGDTCAVVERYGGEIVKVCHTDNLRGHGLSRLNNVAGQYAHSYGARYVPATIDQLKSNRRK